jgi:hypothetical protein
MNMENGEWGMEHPDERMHNEYNRHTHEWIHTKEGSLKKK